MNVREKWQSHVHLISSAVARRSQSNIRSVDVDNQTDFSELSRSHHWSSSLTGDRWAACTDVLHKSKAEIFVRAFSFWLLHWSNQSEIARTFITFAFLPSQTINTNEKQAVIITSHIDYTISPSQLQAWTESSLAIAWYRMISKIALPACVQPFNRHI